jgi:hypothetical protein
MGCAGTNTVRVPVSFQASRAAEVCSGVREVEDRRDALVERRQPGDPVGDVDVLGPVVRPEAEVGGREVLREAAVDEQPADLRLPGMAVRVLQPRDRDAARRLDHDRAACPDRAAEVGAHRFDRGAVEEDVTSFEVADLTIHRNDRSALDQDPAVEGRIAELFEQQLVADARAVVRFVHLAPHSPTLSAPAVQSHFFTT